MKHTKAHDLLAVGLAGSEIFVSVQVLNEYFVNALRLKIPVAETESAVRQFKADFTVVSLTADLQEETMRIYRQYQLQYYDSVIVAAALEAGAEVLYLEDMTDGHIVDRTLKIVNPFLH